METIKNTDTNDLFEKVSSLAKEVCGLKELLAQSYQKEKRLPIGIDEACRIMGKEKPTLYSMVRKGLIPCYKNGKKLYFYEDELLELINRGKKAFNLQ